LAEWVIATHNGGNALCAQNVDERIAALADEVVRLDRVGAM
jgi:hypothetical protein